MTRSADASEFGRVRNIRGKSKRKRKPPIAEQKRLRREELGRAYVGESATKPHLTLADAKASDWIPAMLSGVAAKDSASAFIEYFDAESKRLQWSLSEARQLMREGYTLAHTVRFTGWPEHMLSDVKSYYEESEQ